MKLFTFFRNTLLRNGIHKDNVHKSFITTDINLHKYLARNNRGSRHYSKLSMQFLKTLKVLVTLYSGAVFIGLHDTHISPLATFINVHKYL